MTNATTMPTMSNMKLPPNLDAACWDQLAPLYAQLTSREIASAKNLEQLILDRSDLDAAAEEAQANGAALGLPASLGSTTRTALST